ncbi:hypothetical protein PAEAM_04450 [Paenibacillus sp. GM1FR]|nr:hypothetical protein PAEAM_04450 [Paenibacillus sp. GM1FR]
MKRLVGPLCHGSGRVQFERCVSIRVNGFGIIYDEVKGATLWKDSLYWKSSL